MAIYTWSPLWSKLVDSSIWSEPDNVRIVFVTMLAKKDSDHIVRATAFNIAKWSNKTEREVLDALKVLSSPDKKRLEPQPYEGRRIEKVEDGWLMLNGEEYRKMVQDEMRKSRLRKAQRKFRDTHPGNSGGGKRQQAYVEAYEDGDDAACNRLSAPVVGNGSAAEPEAKDYVTIPDNNVAEPPLCSVCGGCVPETGTVCNGCLDMGRGE